MRLATEHPAGYTIAKEAMQILVVDDDDHIRSMVVELLEDEGYAVQSVVDGLEALDWLRAQPQRPCVILLDLMMPRMDGWAFRRAQREDPALAPIPVVTMSAHANLAATAAPLEPAGIVAKPIDIPHLLAMIAAFCGDTPDVEPGP
jgi:CheY-like chemotaxis protein